MYKPRSIALLLWLACIGGASGEILIAPAAKGKAIPATNNHNNSDKLNEASVLRHKAQAYKSGDTQPIPSSGIPVIIQMDVDHENEEGVLLPRDEETYTVPRIRNQELLPDNNNPAVQEKHPTIHDAESVGKQDIRMQLEKNRYKANQYMKGKSAPSLANPGNVVGCEKIGNVSGRIGDDSMSGREILIIRDGKQIKMRCK